MNKYVSPEPIESLVNRFIEVLESTYPKPSNEEIYSILISNGVSQASIERLRKYMG